MWGRAYLATLRLSDGALILDAETISLPYGHVFFYPSESFARTGRLDDAYGGNGGLLVLADSARLIAFGSDVIDDPGSALRAFADPRARGGRRHRASAT